MKQELTPEYENKLKRLATEMTLQGAFKTEARAYWQLSNDYPKGYPSKKAVDEVINRLDRKRETFLTWDSATGNYNFFWYKDDA